MKEDLPDIIKENGFDFRWDIKKVWALDVPVEKMGLSEIDWMLDMPFWSTGNGQYNLTPRELIKNPDTYPDHKARLDTCDTSHPIDVMKNLKGNWLILDGLHRLVKLIIDGEKSFNARKISRDYIPQILKD